MRRERLVAAIVVLAVVYIVAGKVGLSLALVNSSATAVWPPTGIAIAALLLFGIRLWPGVLIGAFIVNLSTTSGAASSIGIAIGNTLEAVLAARLVNRFARGARAFERPHDVFKFAFLAGLLATNISATVGTTTLGLFGLAPWSDFGPIWFTWWLGDLGGALIVAPAIIVWATDRTALLTRPIERLALGLTALATAVLLFAGTQELSTNREPLGFLTFPVLVWAAVRFGPRDTTAVLLATAAIADWGTLRGFGPFARADVNSSLLFLQAFMTVAAVTSDALAAAIVDRRRAEELVRSTEHRLRTVAEEAARVREEFLSIATHELRTPVTTVRGYAQLAQRALDRDANADVGKELDTIVRQSDRLAALIAQLLDASQLQAGTLAVTPVPTDVSALARQATTAAQIADSHRLIVDIQPGIWANVDPVRFDEVLTNLIDNARKFSPANGAVTVRLADAGSELELSVTDEGPGIAADRLPHVFERFYRAHDDRGIGGLGLGLYIAREIVTRHGGRISVASTPGEGATFIVRVPKLPLTAHLEEPERAVPAVMTGGRVLVVEDDGEIRSLVLEALRASGHEAVGARDGRDGLALAERERPDLIIVDKLMPEMDGTEFSREYRARAGKAPLVAFCASRDAVEWAAAIGAVACISKPFDLAELERVVDRELARAGSAATS
jgi:signal transduction histidine kinase/ActR/RegA family two-component response regulator